MKVEKLWGVTSLWSSSCSLYCKVIVFLWWHPPKVSWSDYSWRCWIDSGLSLRLTSPEGHFTPAEGDWCSLHRGAWRTANWLLLKSGCVARSGRARGAHWGKWGCEPQFMGCAYPRPCPVWAHCLSLLRAQLRLRAVRVHGLWAQLPWKGIQLLGGVGECHG